MKNKLIYAGAIAAIFLTAMIIYRDKLTLEGIILIVGANIGSIRLLWLWLNQKEETIAIKEDFKQATNKTLEQFRAEK